MGRDSSCEQGSYLVKEFTSINAFGKNVSFLAVKAGTFFKISQLKVKNSSFFWIFIHLLFPDTLCFSIWKIYISIPDTMSMMEWNL